MRCHARARSSGDTRSPFDCARSSARAAVHSASRVHGPLQLRVPRDRRGARTTSASPRSAARAVALRHAGYSARSLREGRFESGYQRQRAQKWVSHTVQRAVDPALAQSRSGARRGRAGATGHGRYGACRGRAPAGRSRGRVLGRGPVDGSLATRAGRRGRLAGRAPARRAPGRPALAEVPVRGSRSPRGACVLPTRRDCARSARRG